jgi:hypothetical protein
MKFATQMKKLRWRAPREEFETVPQSGTPFFSPKGFFIPSFLHQRSVFIPPD